MPKSIPNNHQRDSHPLEQKGGDDMQSIGDSVEQWLKAEGMPELSDLSPDNMGVVYVAHHITEQIETDVLRLVEGLDVVLVAPGEELATVMAARFASHTGSLRVVDFLDSTARECYLRWLGELAEKYPRVKVTFAVVGPHPKCGDPFLVGSSIELRDVLEMAPNVFVEKEHVDGQSCSGRPAELWLAVPLDAVPTWVKGDHQGPDFDVPAERGTLRVELRGVDPERRMAQFYIYRRDTGENVAYTDVVLEGELGCSMDEDAFQAVVQPCPEGTEVVIRSIPCSELEEPKATEPSNGDSAVPRDVDEEGEPNETDNG